MSPDRKLEIVLRYLSGEKSEAELRQQHGIRSNKTIYNWVARLRASAGLIFADKRGAPPRNPARLPPHESTESSAEATESDSRYAQGEDDGYDTELAKLYGVDAAAVERLVSRKSKPRPESRRGRRSLERAVADAERLRQQKAIPDPAERP